MHLATGACFDAAGIQGLGTASGIRIDKTAGTASIRTPAAGATYARGSSVLASYACADALSGVASCKGTTANGARISTTTRGGPYTYRVEVTDRAGNVTSTSVSYYVR